MIHLLNGCDGSLCKNRGESWLRWSQKRFGKHQPAMIDLALDYQELVGPKGRNMIRKAAKKGYTFSCFAFNDYVGDMTAINRSLPERGGKPMSEAYQHPVSAIHSVVTHPLCQHHDTFYVGGFRDGHLWAYCYLTFSGELAVINRVLGHGDALKDGVMNGLLAKIVEVAREHSALFVNYLTIESSTKGISGFKTRVGFRSTDVGFAL